MRGNWKLLLGAFVAGVALTPLVFFLPSGARAFVAGAWVASVVWGILLVVILVTGTGSQVMGDLAEQWTAHEIRRLNDAGWRSFDGVRLMMYGDIDHLVVGPGGVLVIETKWRSDEWDLDDPRARPTVDAVPQVAEQAKRVRLWLRPALGDAPVRAVVAAWGDVTGGPVPSADDVMVMRGDQVADWMTGLPGDVLDPGRIQQVREKIEAQLVKRANGPLGPGEEAPEPYVSTAQRILLCVLAGMAGIQVALMVAATVASSSWFALAAMVVLVSVGMLHRRGVWRPYVDVFAVGLAGGAVFIVGGLIVLGIDSG